MTYHEFLAAEQQQATEGDQSSTIQNKIVSQVCLVCLSAVFVASLRDDVFQVCSQHENMSR